jgi:hypothetical protein
MGEEIQDAVTYENIRINGYKLEKILDLKIITKINEHGKLQLTGVLNNDDKDKYIHSTTEDKKIEIYYEKEDGKITLFYGVVTDIEINCRNDVYEMKIQAKSMTYLMDIKKKSRSFQDINLKTKELIKSIMDLDYKGSSYILNIPDEEIRELVIQYEETDFEFLKRLASKYNLGIIITGDYGRIQFTIGVLEESKELINKNTQYEIYKDISYYEYYKENYLQDSREIDYITYKIQTTEVFQLGNNMSFMGHKLYIYDACYEIKDGILENTYYLRIKNGIRQKRYFNYKIIGSSIDGKIINVKNDLVNVHLEIDKEQNKEKAYWFKYSTMSATSDGSGWYCMPEVGDSVRIYFPTKDEDQAFGVSAVSGYQVEEGSTKEDKMGNPDNKYLSTKNDKQLKLTPEGIFISCNSGQAEMSLKKDGTLSINSQNNIDITAEENIKIIAEKSFLVSAKESITFKCDKGGGLDFNTEGELKELGTHVNNN